MLNRLWLYLIALALVLAIVVFGVRQYGKARVAQVQYEAVAEAVSGAVAERKEALGTDVAQAKQSAAVRDSVRSVLVQARKKNAKVPSPGAVLPDCSAGDAERLRVLNDAIAEVNRNVQRAGELPR